MDQVTKFKQTVAKERMVYEFKKKLEFIVDIIHNGSGISNIENTSRRLCQNTELHSWKDY